MTITSIGYGDIAATPGNTSEQVVATALMITGSMLWALILGTIVSSLSNLNPDATAFRSTMSELNRMMSRDNLPQPMRVRLRQYFHQTAHIRASNKRASLLELMSPTLRSAVAWEVNKQWLSRLWFLKGASLTFLVQVITRRRTNCVFVCHQSAYHIRSASMLLSLLLFCSNATLELQLALVLRPIVFAPGEIAPIGPLYIVNRGLALYGGIVYVRATYWGHDVILT